MGDFLSNPSVAIYTAMAVALVVWVAIFAYLWRIDAQARELRRKIEQAPREEVAAPRVTLEARRPVGEERRVTTETSS